MKGVLPMTPKPPLSQEVRRRKVPHLEPNHEEDFYYTSQELAGLLGISPSTLSGYRRQGSGPKFLTLGHRTVRYARKDVLAHMAEKAQLSTSQNDPWAALARKHTLERKSR